MGAGSWGFMLKFKSGRRSTIQWCFVAKAAAMVGQSGLARRDARVDSTVASASASAACRRRLESGPA